MTEKEATKLAAQIERDYAGLIEAKYELYRGTGRIRLLLVAGQRTTLIYKEREWESIKLAWHWLLYGEDAHLEVPPRPGKKPRHLVDGVAMYIFRMKNGYWVGTYTQDKKQRKKYFGKGDDPRDRYPLVEEATV